MRSAGNQRRDDGSVPGARPSLFAPCITPLAISLLLTRGATVLPGTSSLATDKRAVTDRALSDLGGARFGFHQLGQDRLKFGIGLACEHCGQRLMQTLRFWCSQFELNHGWFSVTILS